jgi:hypothetical protein
MIATERAERTTYCSVAVHPLRIFSEIGFLR